MPFSLELSKETFKFSGSHFTIFGASAAERLHGHNYYVRVTIHVDEIDAQLGMAVDFNEIKPRLIELCRDLDEYVLIPERSSHLRITKTPEQVSVQFSSKSYAFPLSDVRLLPLVNITSEELARYLATQLHRRLPTSLKIKRLTLTVEETRGQAASYSL